MYWFRECNVFKDAMTVCDLFRIYVVTEVRNSLFRSSTRIIFPYSSQLFVVVRGRYLYLQVCLLILGCSTGKFCWISAEPVGFGTNSLRIVLLYRWSDHSLLLSLYCCAGGSRWEARSYVTVHVGVSAVSSSGNDYIHLLVLLLLHRVRWMAYNGFLTYLLISGCGSSVCEGVSLKCWRTFRNFRMEFLFFESSGAYL